MLPPTSRSGGAKNGGNFEDELEFEFEFAEEELRSEQTPCI
jgi:hypothetical protein